MLAIISASAVACVAVPVKGQESRRITSEDIRSRVEVFEGYFASALKTLESKRTPADGVKLAQALNGAWNLAAGIELQLAPLRPEDRTRVLKLMPFVDPDSPHYYVRRIVALYDYVFSTVHYDFDILTAKWGDYAEDSDGARFDYPLLVELQRIANERPLLYARGNILPPAADLADIILDAGGAIVLAMERPRMPEQVAYTH